LTDFQKELFERGKIPKETEDLIKKFPKDMHPMT
jgi:citrate synthase